MKAKWLIENYNNSQNCRDLISAVRDSGRECVALENCNYFLFDKARFALDDCVIFQGSIETAKRMASELPAGCSPITIGSHDEFSCRNYYQLFGELLFNREWVISTVGNLKRDYFDLYEKFGREAKIFVRPDSCEKKFYAGLFDLQDFNKDWHSIEILVGSEEALVVSSPKKINGEFRFVCSKTEIIAASTYQYQGQRTLIPSVPPDATKFCEGLLDLNLVSSPVFCMDVFQNAADMSYGLGELTPFSSAGLYECNKKKVVEKVSQIIEHEHLQKLQSATK